MTIEIRQATVLDLPEIMKLETASFDNDAWPEETFKSELAAKHTYYILALEENVVVGYAGLSKLPGSDQADIQTIAVREDKRGLGIGKKLMDTLTLQATELLRSYISCLGLNRLAHARSITSQMVLMLSL